jgi:hypothetical protein
VAAHGVCQAIEHHDGLKGAAALCAAAVAVIATLRLVGGGGVTRRRVPIVRVALVGWIPATSLSVEPRASAVWLQRFQN